jgi:hypothetical protein
VKIIKGESTMLVQRHAGPSLFGLTIAYFAMFIASASRLSVAFHVPHIPADAVAFVAQNNSPIRWGSFFGLASAIPLGIFMAVSISRLRFLGVRSAGEQIAVLGGIATPMMLAGSALATWSLTRPGVAASPGAVEALQSLGFDGGGPGFAVFLGLFLAGVSVSAGMTKLIPSWLMWLGIVVAAAGELSSFTLVNFTAGYFIPVTRFLSILWMFGMALKLPTTHPLREINDLGAEILTDTLPDAHQP